MKLQNDLLLQATNSIFTQTISYMDVNNLLKFFYEENLVINYNSVEALLEFMKEEFDIDKNKRVPIGTLRGYMLNRNFEESLIDEFININYKKKDGTINMDELYNNLKLNDPSISRKKIENFIQSINNNIDPETTDIKILVDFILS